MPRGPLWDRDGVVLTIWEVSGLAYYVGPQTPANPVLLLHSWHGLNAATKKLADRLADEGCTVLVPDLLTGALPSTQAEAEETLAAADPNRLVAATLGGLEVLAKSAPGPATAFGLGMGGSMALWVSVRRPHRISAVVSFYGTQAIDFAGSRARYQLHLAGDDPWVSSDDAAFMEATMGLEGISLESYRYPGTRPGFFEEGENYDLDAADLAWERTRSFLQSIRVN
jgi:carboxymethylenebutenolidase